MMFSKQESLPVHGGNNRFNNGVSNIPVVNKNVRNLLPPYPTLIVGAAFLAIRHLVIVLFLTYQIGRSFYR